MRRWRCIVFLFSMLMLYTVSCAGKTDWHLERNKEGVKVYTRAVSNSSINELRAEMTVHANLNSIMALLRDVPAFKEWVYHCKESHELKRNGNEVYYYQYTSVPFPISDRDLIIHSNWHQDPVTKAIYIAGEGVPNYVPQKSGVVRIEKFKSNWSLIPRGNGDVFIEYEISVDPAGWVPAWLVNLSAVEGPFETCKSLKNILNTAKYSNPIKVVKEPFTNSRWTKTGTSGK